MECDCDDGRTGKAAAAVEGGGRGRITSALRLRAYHGLGTVSAVVRMMAAFRVADAEGQGERKKDDD